jgi:hypothetical protein
MTRPEPLPWQQQNLDHVLQLRRAGRMPHALMLHGLVPVFGSLPRYWQAYLCVVEASHLPVVTVIAVA